MDEVYSNFPHLIGDVYINHNHISYLSQIYCIWTWTQVWGLSPQWATRTVCPLVRTRYTWSNFMVALAYNM